MKIGIRELKARAPQVVREVRETGRAVDITYHGRVVARLTPAEEKTGAGDFAKAWAEFDRVGRQISRKWPKRVSAVQAIREQRRKR